MNSLRSEIFRARHIPQASLASRALRRAENSKKDIDPVELNEGFAAQRLADGGRWENTRLDRKWINVDSGTITIGSPLGAPGVGLLGTLVHEFGRFAARYRPAAICAGGRSRVGDVIDAV